MVSPVTETIDLYWMSLLIRLLSELKRPEPFSAIPGREILLREKKQWGLVNVLWRPVQHCGVKGHGNVK